MNWFFKGLVLYILITVLAIGLKLLFCGLDLYGMLTGSALMAGCLALARTMED